MKPRYYLVGTLSLICGACISPRDVRVDREGVRPTQTTSLGERAERLWTAKRAEDWSALFLLQDPATLAGASEDEFVAWCAKEEPFRILAYEIATVLSDGDFGWVEVRYRTTLRKFPDMPPKDAPTWQKWHRVAGEWFPVPTRALSSYPESPATRNAAEETRLRARFMESWRARRAKDWRELYRLSDPQDHQDVAEDVFVEAEDMYEYFSFNIHWIEAVADRGRIRVLYEHKLDDPSLTKLPVTMAYVTETWVLRDGEWFRDLKR